MRASSWTTTPRTSTRRRWSKSTRTLDGRFRGIGVQIRRDIARDGLLVVTPIRGSPAYKAGILAGDLITEIIRETRREGQAARQARRSSRPRGWRRPDAVKLIMGLPATKLKLKIEREGEKKPIDQRAGPRHGDRGERLRLEAEPEGRLLGLLHRSEEQDRLHLPDPVRPVLGRGDGQGRQAARARTASRGWCWTCGSTRAGSWTWP